MLLHFLVIGVGFPGGSAVKNPPAKAGEAKDTGLILGSGRSPGGGHGNPLQCSCLGNPIEEAGRPQSIGLYRVRYNLACTHA